MVARKTVAMTFRVTPEFRQLLEMAACHERRSRTNMLEALLFEYCRLQGLLVTPLESTAARDAAR